MDLTSIWLSNSVLFDEMTEFDYKFKQKQIIDFFGGTKSIIKMLLKHKCNLSYLQHHELSKILKTIHQDKNEINKNTNNKVSISTRTQTHNKLLQYNSKTFYDLNKNCLSYICKYLSDFERNTSFGLISRKLNIISKMKNSLSDPNEAPIKLPISRLYYFINLICDNKANLSKLISTSELLFLWINNIYSNCINSDQRNVIYKICESISLSGLLSIYSNLLTNQNMINNDTNLICNILYLFKMISEFHELQNVMINSNILKNAVVLLQNQSDSVILENIIFMTFNLLNNGPRSIPHNRVMESKIVEHIIMKLKSSKLKLNIISVAIKIISNWINHSHYLYSDNEKYPKIILNNIIPQTMSNISNLICTINNAKTWICELSANSQIIVSENGIEFVFRIKEIVKLPLHNDINPNITLLGHCIHIGMCGEPFGPYQLISIPLQNIRCCVQGSRTPFTVYEDIKEVFRSISALVSSFCHCYNRIDFSGKHKQVAVDIKRIFVTIEDNSYYFLMHKQILMDFLVADWSIFFDLLGDQIEQQCGQTIFELLELLDVSCRYNYCDKNVDSLCQKQWFRERFRGVQNFSRFFNVEFDTRILIALLRNFYDDTEFYDSLKMFIRDMQFDFVNNGVVLTGKNIIDHQDFVNNNGVEYLVKIISNQLQSPNAQIILGNNSIYSISYCKLIEIYSHLPGSYIFRNVMLGEIARCSKSIGNILKDVWVSILVKSAINDTSCIPDIIKELNWCKDSFQSDTSVVSHINSALTEISNFLDI